MKYNYLFAVLCFALIFLVQDLQAQNAKKLYKSGNDLAKSGNYKAAVLEYSKAIELDNTFEKAYEARANAYEQTGELENAAKDYETLSELIPQDYKFAIKSAGLYLRINEFSHALSLIKAVEGIAPKSHGLFAIKADAQFGLKKYADAVETLNVGIKSFPVPEFYFLRGKAFSELKNDANAQSDFTESLKLKPDFTEAQVYRAAILFKSGKQNEALTDLNAALSKDQKNQKALMLRSRIHAEKTEYQAAINDLSTIISFAPGTTVLLERGLIYKRNNQTKEAIEDFSSVLHHESTNTEALENRAECSLKLNMKKEAEKDYSALVQIIEKDKYKKELLERCKKNLFELRREQNSPKISAIHQNLNENKLEIAEGLDAITLKLKITDENPIAQLMINGNKTAFNQDSLNKQQNITINIQNKTKVEIVAEDVYQNKASLLINIVRRDEGLPKIAITSPIANESGVIFLKPNETELTIEGRILGQNPIDSILINNVAVVFDNSTNNPLFKTRINPNGIETIKFKVIDNKGNTINKTFSIDRSDAVALSDNPMGRTWVVFIENSEYKTFTSLEAPKKEIELMIKALSKYKIDKIIHKRNLSKAQMESFFSVELKNQVIENRVNSLLIWYAGHGKLVGHNGYWIPVDSKMDDVASYYNINTMKSSIKPYLQNITHSLIVTDACETGPGFYMSMRAIPSEKNCSDTKSTKFKSSQVFTSSGYDMSEGDSEFTKSFANSLMFDNNSCIPIERIVNKVSSDVAKKSKNRPKFGKISGFEDENGTFLFIRKD